MIASVLGMILGTFIYTYFFAKAIDLNHDITAMVYPLLLAGGYYLAVYIWRRRYHEKTSTGHG